jgi:hypothetical protein
MAITDAQSNWMFGLLTLWAALLFGGFIFGKENADHTHRIPRWARIASSFTLVVAVWSWRLFAKDDVLGQLASFIAIGMTLGFIGDLFMAQLMPIKDYVLGGIASFGLGHIAYIAGLITIGNEAGLNDPIKRWVALLVWLVVAFIAWYFVVFRGRQHSVLHYAALPYSLLLASTAGFATGLALQDSRFIALAVGAALFLLSDLILAAQLFNKLHFRLIGDVVWFMYGPGQMLIVFVWCYSIRFL